MNTTDTVRRFEYVNEDPCGLSKWSEDGYEPSERLRKIRDKLPPGMMQAFEALRERGIITDTGTSDCRSCGGYEQTLLAEELVEEGHEVLGAVSFTGQDDATAPFLRYGPLHSEERGKIGVQREAVGEIVCEELDRFGVPYEWSGDGSDAIKVTN